LDGAFFKNLAGIRNDFPFLKKNGNTMTTVYFFKNGDACKQLPVLKKRRKKSIF
jgi:hypothetical protein